METAFTQLVEATNAFHFYYWIIYVPVRKTSLSLSLRKQEWANIEFVCFGEFDNLSMDFSAAFVCIILIRLRLELLRRMIFFCWGDEILHRWKTVGEHIVYIYTGELWPRKPNAMNSIKVSWHQTTARIEINKGFQFIWTDHAICCALFPHFCLSISCALLFALSF